MEEKLSLARAREDSIRTKKQQPQYERGFLPSFQALFDCADLQGGLEKSAALQKMSLAVWRRQPELTLSDHRFEDADLLRAQVMEHWHLGIGRKPSLSPPELRRELRQLLTENQGISASKLQGLLPYPKPRASPFGLSLGLGLLSEDALALAETTWPSPGPRPRLLWRRQKAESEGPEIPGCPSRPDRKKDRAIAGAHVCCVSSSASAIPGARGRGRREGWQGRLHLLSSPSSAPIKAEL